MNKMMKWLGVTAMSFGLFACSENGLFTRNGGNPSF